MLKRKIATKRCGPYVTSAVPKALVGGKGIQHIDDGSEQLEQFGIAPPEFFKKLRLFLEYNND